MILRRFLRICRKPMLDDTIRFIPHILLSRIQTLCVLGRSWQVMSQELHFHLSMVSSRSRWLTEPGYISFRKFVVYVHCVECDAFLLSLLRSKVNKAVLILELEREKDPTTSMNLFWLYLAETCSFPIL